jgi:hypothetical protein
MPRRSCQAHGSCANPGRKLGSRPAAVRSTLHGILVAIVSVVVALLAFEFLIRLNHRELFTITSQLVLPPTRTSRPRAEYHPELGWVPRAGAFQGDGQNGWSVSQAGLRSNGSAFASADQPLLVVGDSFTFGDEVQDHETWPAQLERRLNKPVLNGGVFAYGVDQAVLRAGQLLDTHEPDVVLLAFISDDINRAEFSYYLAWKPYFEYSGGGLSLNNVPVPEGPNPGPPYSRMRKALSYSFLCSAILRRVAPEWWHSGAIRKVHDDGEAVSVELLVRLHDLVQAKHARLLVIALSTNGHIGGNERTPAVVERARQRGVQVLDLVPDIGAMLAADQQDLFLPGGHYSPQLNGWVAARVAEYLEPN